MKGGEGVAATLGFEPGEFDWDDDHGICYPYMVHIGPPHFSDIVQVAGQLKQLGYTVTRG